MQMTMRLMRERKKCARDASERTGDPTKPNECMFDGHWSQGNDPKCAKSAQTTIEKLLSNKQMVNMERGQKQPGKDQTNATVAKDKRVEGSIWKGGSGTRVDCMQLI